MGYIDPPLLMFLQWSWLIYHTNRSKLTKYEVVLLLKAHYSLSRFDDSVVGVVY